jgi:hypothetical protein
MMFNYDEYLTVVLVPLTDSCSSFLTSVLEHLSRSLPLAHDSISSRFFFRHRLYMLYPENALYVKPFDRVSVIMFVIWGERKDCFFYSRELSMGENAELQSEELGKPQYSYR